MFLRFFGKNEGRAGSGKAVEAVPFVDGPFFVVGLKQGVLFCLQINFFVFEFDRNDVKRVIKRFDDIFFILKFSVSFRLR